MIKVFQKWWKSLKKEVKSHRVIYILLAVILALGFFLRVYRVGQVLGFYFDQGRDALVIWDLWYKGKLFLIGPTTGIAGIFRGPFYYYLIAPFYLIGGGNPVAPAVFLAFTSILAVGLLYYLGMKIQDRETGILAAILASFSFYIILASRWLSNPTPMLLLSVILVWMFVLVTEGKRWAWPIIAFVAGLSLFHFGSAGELFYFLAIFIFAIWQKKNLPDKKMFWFSVIAFTFTALPLVIFDIKHGGILSQNIKKFLVEDQSFKLSFWEVAKTRLAFYYDVFFNKIFHSWRGSRETAFLLIVGLYFLRFIPELWKKSGVKILLILLVSPMIGLLFFQGNFGNIYDYYLTGYFLIFILLFAIVLGLVWRSTWGKIFTIVFLLVFITWSVKVTWSKLSDGVDGPHSVALKNELQIIDWVFMDARGRENFNVDVYVPPVISYAYDYLFLWQGTFRQGELGCAEGLCGLVEERTSLLYTVFEVDPPHPERLEAWMERQRGIGKVEEEVKFGGITVQRRTRL